jgi:hypothetical protein
MKLVLEDGTELNPGDRVTTIRGEEGTLRTFTPPQQPGSPGRVFVQLDVKQGRASNLKTQAPIETIFAPSVIGAKWID